MKQYSYNHYARTHQAVDYHSLLAAVDASMESDCQHHHREYYGRYSEDFNKLANLSGYIYTDLERVPRLLGELLPPRRYKFNVDDGVKGSGIVWFNYATAWILDSNLYLALDNEEEYDILPDPPRDIWNIEYKVRQQRQNTVERLSKDQIAVLMIAVCGIIAKVTELQEGLNTLAGLIDELDARQNVIVKDDGAVVLHPAAQL